MSCSKFKNPCLSRKFSIQYAFELFFQVHKFLTESTYIDFFDRPELHYMIFYCHSFLHPTMSKSAWIDIDTQIFYDHLSCTMIFFALGHFIYLSNGVYD